MPAIFDFLYQEYCRARLAEMRKQLWLSTHTLDEIAEACDASNPGSADRDGIGDDRTSGQHEDPTAAI